MNQWRAIVLLALCIVMSACGGSSGSGPTTVVQTYTVALTDIELVKKGSTALLVVDGLPAEGATLTRN